MKVSKTLFKNLSRCKAYKGLNLACETEVEDSIYDILEAIGTDDDENPDNKQIEVLMPYFDKVEDLALSKALEKFPGIAKTQRTFSYNMEPGYEFYTRGDICFESEEEVIIIEVKASTTSEFIKLGYKSKGDFFPVFEKNTDNVLILKDELGHSEFLTDKKYMNQKAKLLDRYTDIGRHIYDIAFQRYVIENSNIFNKKKIKYYLALLNNKYIFDGSIGDNGEKNYRDIDGESLINFVDVDSLTKEIQPKIAEEVSKIITNDGNTLKCDVGKFCQRKKTTECKFLKVCWKEALEDDSILEFIDNHHGFKDESGEKKATLDLINTGITSVGEILYEWLSREKNKIQKDCIENDEPYINSKKIEAGIATLKYPIYHLDFETFPCPLPRFKGEKPYSQSLFQFSIHVERESGVCDLEKDHLEFLAKDSNDYREEIAKKLLESIEDEGGSVVVYNKTFETLRIQELSEVYPQYRESLLKINDRIFDLLHLLKGNEKFYTSLGYSKDEAKELNYYHKDLRGSYSLKSVLPVFSDLNYQTLSIGNGIEAYVNYSTLDELKEEDTDKYNKVIDGLTKYCQQDTWAMFEILTELKKIVQY